MAISVLTKKKMAKFSHLSIHLGKKFEEKTSKGRQWKGSMQRDRKTKNQKGWLAPNLQITSGIGREEEYGVCDFTLLLLNELHSKRVV